VAGRPQVISKISGSKLALTNSAKSSLNLTPLAP
jgi:hypothetical protein